MTPKAPPTSKPKERRRPVSVRLRRSATSVPVFINTPTSAGGPDTYPRIMRKRTGPPALRAPAGREPDRRPALRAGPIGPSQVVALLHHTALSRLGRCSLASPSSSLLASEAAALGAYVAVFMNTSTKESASNSGKEKATERRTATGRYLPLERGKSWPVTWELLGAVALGDLALKEASVT